MNEQCDLARVAESLTGLADIAQALAPGAALSDWLARAAPFLSPVHLVATVEAPGQPTGRRKVGRSAGPSTGPAGLGQELQLFGRDRVFEDALAEAAALVPA